MNEIWSWVITMKPTWWDFPAQKEPSLSGCLCQDYCCSTHQHKETSMNMWSYHKSRKKELQNDILGSLVVTDIAYLITVQFQLGWGHLIHSDQDSCTMILKMRKTIKVELGKS